MRAAASLVLVRDGAGGMEVLLVQRGDAGDFPGLHVFPGGLVDRGDHDPRLAATSTLAAEAADALLGSADALPAFFAAMRECVEEIGVLPGAPDFAQASAWQQSLIARTRSFADLVADDGVTLGTASLGYFSHWITPTGIPRRYDTRFFVAVMPAGQQVRVDGREAVRADWLTPSAALTAHERGDIKLIFPTIRNLAALAGHETSASLLAYTRQPRRVPVMQPKLVNTSGGVRLLLPGDAGYEDA